MFGKGRMNRLAASILSSREWKELLLLLWPPAWPKISQRSSITTALVFLQLQERLHPLLAPEVKYASTSNDGRFTFRDLKEGKYRLSAAEGGKASVDVKIIEK